MVAMISLGVAALGLLRWLRADFAAWYEGREMAMGIAVVALLALSFVSAQILCRPAAAAPIQPR